MKKLCYVANIRLPTEKAHGIQIMKMCEAFVLSGYKVELVVPNRFTPIKEDPFVYYGVPQSFKIVRLWSADLVKYGKMGFLVQEATFAFSVIWYTLRSNDIIYTRDEIIMYLMNLLKKFVVWEAHTNTDNFFTRRFPKDARIIVITTKLKEHFINNGFLAKNILVAHDAVDAEQFSADISKSELKRELDLPLGGVVVAYVGKYKTKYMSKGVEQMLESFQQASQVLSQATFLIVGASEREKLEILESARRLGLDSRLRVVGHVPHKLAISYVLASDVLVSPYPNIPHYAYYMSPLKLFEYMASGNAIVATRLPSVEEVINDKAAILVAPGDSNDMARAIISLAESFDLRQSLGKIARQMVAERTWKNRAISIKNLIESA